MIKKSNRLSVRIPFLFEATAEGTFAIWILLALALILIASALFW